MGNKCCCAASDQTVTKKPQVGGSVVPKPEESFAYVDSLPGQLEKRTIDHVYDGDTLTLVEGKARVRFRGIDAPELKEKEPFAEESANLVKKLCPKGSTVWLEFDDAENKDRYGRLLAYVYIAAPNGRGGYVNVNILLLEQGLARFYQPQNTPLSKKDVLLSAQRKARQARRNIWQTVNEKAVVYVTRNGNAYHRKDCSLVKKMKLTETTIGEAVDRGLNGCRNCQPA